MKQAQLAEILDILQDEKRCYYHYQQGHIPLLVSRWLESFNASPLHQRQGRVATVNDFKTSRFARWQHNTVIKSWLASHSGRNAVLKALPHIALSYPDTNPMGYAITLNQWGSEDKDDIYWNQTSRLGYNLVVQLNLPLEVLRLYEKMKIEQPAENCQFSLHPSHDKRMTLAWARLDIDLDNNQVIIEEIQSDWVGELMWSIRRAERIVKNDTDYQQSQKHLKTFQYQGSEIRCQQYIDAMKHLYEQYKNAWASMMITATLEFIWQELGHDMQIFYHQYEMGCKIKNCTPPRSLYTTVPEKMGFKVTDIMPTMLETDKTSKKRLTQTKKQYPHIDMRFYRLA